MSKSQLQLYDDAYFNLINLHFPNNVIVAPVDLALVERHRQIEKLDKQRLVVGTALPFVSIWRTENSPTDEEFYNEALFRTGEDVPDTNDQDITKLRSLPISIKYNTELWANSKTEQDELYREITFLLRDKPRLVFNIAGLDYFFFLKIIGYEETTDITEFMDNKKLYRTSLEVEIPQARIFMLSKSTPKTFTYRIELN